MTDEIRHPPNALIGEVASLFHLLGGMSAKHLVIVGGLVPPLLAPDAADAHIGSADIDLCLSLAITGGATREYYRSIEEILERYFEPERASGFRWRKKHGAPGLPLILDFLAPTAEDDTILASKVVIEAAMFFNCDRGSARILGRPHERAAFLL